MTFATPEGEDLAAERIMVELLSHERSKSVKATTHIGRAGGQPYPHNFAKHLKAIRWKTPIEAVCHAWTTTPDIFKLNPRHLTPGPNT